MAGEYYAVQAETPHSVPKCMVCGWVGPWRVAPLLEWYHIVIALLFLFAWGGGLIYLLIVLLVRGNESNRAKICPNCGSRNMHSFLYADGPAAAPAIAPVAAPAPRASATVYAPAGVAAAATAPTAIIHVNGKAATSLPRTLGVRYTVGRNADSSVVVNDPMVSGMHAVLQVHSSGEIGVYDAGSTNGTFVNGALLAAEHRLRPGDEVTLGSSNCRLTVD